MEFITLKVTLNILYIFVTYLLLLDNILIFLLLDKIFFFVKMSFFFYIYIYIYTKTNCHEDNTVIYQEIHPPFVYFYTIPLQNYI